MKRVLLVLSLVCAMFMSATIAKADIVNDWTYKTTGVLKDVTWSGGFPGWYGAVGHGVNGGYTEYQWGDNKQLTSGLVVDSYEGNITTEGSAEKGLLITHRNENVNSSYKMLTGGTIFTTIEISGDNGQAAYEVTSSIDFKFYETPNDGVGYDDDIFFMTASEIMKGVGDFTYGGQRYYVYLHSNIQALEGEYLKMAQEYGNYTSDTPLYGWTTKEGESLSNAYELSLKISRTPPVVPVPAAVWLMGTGLAGLMALKRRNKA